MKVLSQCIMEDDAIQSCLWNVYGNIIWLKNKQGKQLNYVSADTFYYCYYEEYINTQYIRQGTP